MCKEGKNKLKIHSVICNFLIQSELDKVGQYLHFTVLLGFPNQATLPLV